MAVGIGISNSESGVVLTLDQGSHEIVVCQSGLLPPLAHVSAAAAARRGGLAAAASCRVGHTTVAASGGRGKGPCRGTSGPEPAEVPAGQGGLVWEGKEGVPAVAAAAAREGLARAAAAPAAEPGGVGEGGG